MQTSGYTFRIAEARDIPAIVELVHAAYRGESSRAGWTTEADFLDGSRTDSAEVTEILNTPNNVILLCEHTHQLMASVHLQQQHDYTYLGMFAVRPTQQNSGIGKALLGYAENFAREHFKTARMQMSVITLRHELIAWYERRGYKRTAIFKPFPYGIARYGTPKRDDLILEILEKKWK
jgi:ribosomal protein S18 acetylase RimI-like enzyme